MTDSYSQYIAKTKEKFKLPNGLQLEPNAAVAREKTILAWQKEKERVELLNMKLALGESIEMKKPTKLSYTVSL